LILDPLKWVPKQNEMGCFVEWGIQDVYTDFMAFNLRRMAVQLLYGEWAKEKAVDLVSDEPALQFVSALAWRKEQSVFAFRKSLSYSFPALEYFNEESDCSKKNKAKKEHPPDYVLDISILSLEPKTWRRIKVSSATSLSILHDKIISPAFGWTRNYHAYVFTDQRDGALFGPVKSNAIDMMHLPSNGYLMLDDTRFFLGDVLQNVNETLTYDYDLGDHFEHVIKLVQIINNNPDGKCVVMDGAGCPLPEDSVGSPGYKGVQGYQALLDAWPKNSPGKKKALQHTISQALNYSGKPRFEPGVFNANACQADLLESWMTRASLQEGSKMVLFSAKGQGPPSSLHIHGSGRKEVVVAVEKGVSYLKQVVSTRRDPKWNAICAACGNPNDLKACGCRGIWYCSVSCQKINRPRHQDHCNKRSEFRKLMLKAINKN
jgi:Plasmid pRiA4b ORF-3-like protein/MYND finger